MNNSSYILLTAAKNESRYIEDTIKSVICQSIKPLLWFIVNDGSTDNTKEIINDYLGSHKFIRLIDLPPKKNRNFGSQAKALRTAYKNINIVEYSFIGNIDADITLANDYYGTIINIFKKYPKLGLAGGVIYEMQNGSFQPRKGNSLRSVPHGIQLFRKEIFEVINGYKDLKYGGSDWVAEIECRINGWDVQSFSNIKVFHNRKTLGAEGLLRGAFRQGKMDYSIGSDPVFEIFKCLSRIQIFPHLLYSIFRFFGYSYLFLKNEQLEVPNHISSFLKKEQRSRLFNVTKLK